MKPPKRHSMRLAAGGRIVIPADARADLGLEVGTELIFTVERDRATIMSAKTARRLARERLRPYLKSTVSLSEELMAERKAEARRESREHS